MNERVSPDPGPYLAGHAIEPAVQYVQKIKASCDHETYRQFLGILSQYHHATEAIDEVRLVYPFFTSRAPRVQFILFCLYGCISLLGRGLSADFVAVQRRTGIGE